MGDDPLRLWSSDDYPMLKTWWEGHGWSGIPERLLPPLGVIYENRAAGWMYMDNGGTGVAMMEWLVTNPESSSVKAAKALMNVVRFLKSEASRMQYPIILSTCRQSSLAKLLNREGFDTTDSGMIHLMHISS